MILWVALSAALGAAVALLSFELLGLVLLPFVATLLVVIGRRHNHQILTLVIFVCGFEVSVGWMVWSNIQSSREPGVYYSNIGAVFEFCGFIAAVGLATLAIGLRAIKHSK